MTRLSVRVMLSVPRSARPDDLGSYAHHAEQLGIDAAFVGDHLVAAVPILDSTLTLATVAAVTDRIGIGFGVMLPALRGAAWAAKQIAILQLLSHNRVILGVGAGGEEVRVRERRGAHPMTSHGSHDSHPTCSGTTTQEMHDETQHVRGQTRPATSGLSRGTATWLRAR